MLSFPDMAILSGLALIVFGPERLPHIARQVGRAVGEVRATSAAFVTEMERAADPVPAPLPSTDLARRETHSDAAQSSSASTHEHDPVAHREDADKS